MKANHTPGPWEYRIDYQGCPYVSHGDYMLADVNMSHCSGKEAIANGKLIASAPLMLEVVKSILDENKDGLDRSGWRTIKCLEIKAAIAAAEGK